MSVYLGSNRVGNTIALGVDNQNKTVTPSTSQQVIIADDGYSGLGTVTVEAVPTGVATAPTSISGSSAAVSTGTNTITLTKSVSVTPRITTEGYISIGTAGNSSVSLQADVTTKGATTYTPTTSNQTISSGTYLTGTQTISGDVNLIAKNIKQGVTIFGVTGTYDGTEVGDSIIDTATKTLSSVSTSIQFTGLAAQPESFAVLTAANLATGDSPWKTAIVVYDGSSIQGDYITNTSKQHLTASTHSSSNVSFTHSYSNGTLTITGTNSEFQDNEYKLVYSYGDTPKKTTATVGSGATSITFNNIVGRPKYFVCLIEGTEAAFGTSSGYQRVIGVANDGTNTFGVAMGSGAVASTTSWTYSYNSGSLTITSSGTNNGGYFHQGTNINYKLIYAI